MGLIDELLLDGLLGGLGPSSSRGLLFLGALFGIGLAGASGWCLLRGIDPLHGPEWAFGVLVVSAVGAPIALLLCVTGAIRETEARGFAILAVIANTAAFLTTIAAVVRN
jgi:hypothetical protein